MHTYRLLVVKAHMYTLQHTGHMYVHTYTLCTQAHTVTVESRVLRFVPKTPAQLASLR